MEVVMKLSLGIRLVTLLFSLFGTKNLEDVKREIAFAKLQRPDMQFQLEEQFIRMAEQATSRSFIALLGSIFFTLFFGNIGMLTALFLDMFMVSTLGRSLGGMLLIVGSTYNLTIEAPGTTIWDLAAQRTTLGCVVLAEYVFIALLLLRFLTLTQFFAVEAVIVAYHYLLPLLSDKVGKLIQSVRK